MHIRASFVWSIALCSVLASVTSAQNPLDEWKQRNRKDGRWEGVVAVNAGNPAFELRSFSATFPKEIKEDALLQVGVMPTGSEPVTIIAVEIEDFESYRMESFPLQRQRPDDRWVWFSTWRSSDVIKGLGIRASNLGVVAYEGDPRNTASSVVVPAYVSSPPHATGVIPRLEQYTVVLRPSATVTNVSCVVTNAQGARVFGVDVTGRTLGRSALRCVLPAHALTDHKGLMTLTVSGSNLLKQNVRFAVRFHHVQPS